jgi:hypothetical protein
MDVSADGSGLIPSDFDAERGLVGCLIVADPSSRTTAVQLDNRSSPPGPDGHPPNLVLT